MKPGELFRKTMPFCMARLMLGGAMVLISVILLAILMGIGLLFGDGGMLVCLLIWLGSIGVIRFVVMHYFGYLVKAGHVAVLAQAATTGVIPEHQVQFGKQSVKERFATTNIYFAVDKLVTGAVRQIQRQIGKLENALDFIPGMEVVGGLAKFYVDLSLGYIDECCLGYTVYRKDQGAFHSACDGVAIYAQNIGKLLKSSAMTMLKVLLLLAGVVIAVFVPVGLIFVLLGWSPLAALLLSLLIAWTIKFALVDSYILCLTMSSYMSAAQNTQITFDLYGMLSGISSSFKKLWEERSKENGGQEKHAQPVASSAAYNAGNPLYMDQTTAVNNAANSQYPQTFSYPEQGQPIRSRFVSAEAQSADQSVYQPPSPPRSPYAEQPPRRRRSGNASSICPRCGTFNAHGSRFCGGCGTWLAADDTGETV